MTTPREGRHRGPIQPSKRLPVWAVVGALVAALVGALAAALVCLLVASPARPPAPEPVPTTVVPVPATSRPGGPPTTSQ
jgi:hypothetical protein